MRKRAYKKCRKSFWLNPLKLKVYRSMYKDSFRKKMIKVGVDIIEEIHSVSNEDGLSLVVGYTERGPLYKPLI